MKKKQLSTAIKLSKEIAGYGEDKLKAEIYSALLRKWLSELCDFDEYLVKGKHTKIRKRFKKVIKIVGRDVGTNIYYAKEGI